MLFTHQIEKPMKFFRFVLLFAGLMPATLVVGQTLEEKLRTLGLDSLRSFEISRDGYTEAWEMFISQPLNHDEPDGKRFQQRVILRHRDFNKPMVLVTEGYAAHYGLSPRYDDELAARLETNLLVAEHRFFGRSVPDSLDWNQLNLKNSTADLHRITTTFKELYTSSWLSTGISKGGQTSIYYRYFYPDDVQASVPYVAPLNFSDEDERVYHFLDTVGPADCRERIYQIQRRLLADQEVFRPMFADSVAKRKLTFERVGGVEKAFEYNVLEFSFAYWQWYPILCDDLPQADADSSLIFKTFAAAAGYDFFADQSIASYEPFFYQALTEMGMYNYSLEGFDDLILYVKEPNFYHAVPKDITLVYEPTLSMNVAEWLKQYGNNMLYIYGAYDAWSSTAVQTGEHTNAIKLLLPFGSHSTRLRHFPEEVQQNALLRLREWLDYLPEE
jgi:hypothetical protein